MERENGYETDAERSWDEEYGERAQQPEEGPEEAALDRAWAKLDAEEPQQALEELLQLDPDWPERWIPESLARAELGELAAARRILDRASEIPEIDDHPDYLWARAQLLLREWRIGEGKAALERLLKAERSAAALDRLALCAEIEGDLATADRLLSESAALDPKSPPIPRLSPEEFEAVITEAIGALPPEIRASLEQTEIVVEPVPSPWMVDLRDPGETPPDVLGLFVGASDLERSGYDTGALPPRVFLFQRNLERTCRDRAELVEQIRVTLFHEIGHLLGFDEQGVAEMGLE